MNHRKHLAAVAIAATCTALIFNAPFNAWLLKTFPSVVWITIG